MVTIEQRIDWEIWEMLQQIKQDSILTPSDKYVTYAVSEEPIKGYPSPDNQRKIIDKLESLNVIKIVSRNHLSAKGSPFDPPSLAVYGVKPKGFTIKILEDNFNIMFLEYEKKYFNETGNTTNDSDLIITKRGDYFYYKEKRLDLSKNTNYYKVFHALYDIAPRGGEVKYEELGDEIKRRVKETKNMTIKEIRKFIQRNLTDQTNGFLKRAQINLESGIRLIEIITKEGIRFNNKI